MGDGEWSWSQNASAGSNSLIQQAARDINNFNLVATQGPGLVSLQAPWGRLPEQLRGRDGLSADLLQMLADPPGRVVVLHGVGGSGKSALALWLARRAVDQQVPVWWVPADDAQVLSDGLREVAFQAGAEPQSVALAWSGVVNAPDLVWRSLDALESRWVLVLDNADDFDALSGGGRLSDGTGWLRTPRQGHGLVVVTSRQGNPRLWQSGTDLRPVAGLDAIDAGQVLTDLVGSGAGSVVEAQSLGERLGGLPLALWLAGRYLAASGGALAVPGLATPRTFADYQAALDERVDVLDAQPADHEEERRDRELISRTWELSLDLLDRRGRPLARPLLRLLSCLGQAPIPVDMLDAELMAGAPMWAALTPESLAGLLPPLLDLGLVERAELAGRQALALHPLVRETNRQRMSAELGLDQHIGTVVRLLDAMAAGTQITPETWSRWHALAAHAESALQLCRAYLDRVPRDTVERAVALVQRAVVFRRHVQDLDQAVTDLQAIVEVQGQTLGEHHQETLATRMDLVLLRGKGGLQDSTEGELLEVLDCQRRELGDRHPDTLRTQQALAGRLGERGEWPSAEQEYRRILEIVRNDLGQDHAGTLACQHGVALALFRQGRLDEAETEFRISLEEHRRVYGPEHYDTLSTWHGYATVLASKDASRAAAAEEFRSILEVCERKGGEKSEPTLAAQHGLAVTLRRMGKDAEAKSVYEELLAAGRPTLGDEHPGLLASRANLALLEAKLGDAASAEAELREVLSIQRRVYGDAHPATLRTCVDLALVLLESGNRSAAALELYDVLPTASSTLSRSHPLVLEIFLILDTLAMAPLNRRDRRRDRRRQQRQQRRRR